MTRDHHSPELDSLTELPKLPELLGRIREHIVRRGKVGLLSLHLMRPDDFERRHGLDVRERLFVATSRFLRDFSERSMRHDDEALEVMISGSTFVLLVGPPREKSDIGLMDLVGARDRLEAALEAFLESELPSELLPNPLSCGCAMVETPAEDEPLDRQVYAALDAALADALRRNAGEIDEDLSILRHVLDDGALDTVFQPVIDLVGNRVIGYEALSRPQTDPPIPPERLFRIAHEQDALWRLERLARESSIGKARDLAPGQLLFMNIDPDALEDPILRGPETLARLRSAGLSPSRVVLELTEQRALSLGVPLRRALEGFRRMGFRLALDDVGAGYAGLSTIAEVQPDYLKLDMSLVRNLHRHALKRGLVETIQEFCERADISLVAEGLEQPEELRELRSLGVRLAQGFLLARPGRVLDDGELSCPGSGPADGAEGDDEPVRRRATIRRSKRA